MIIKYRPSRGVGSRKGFEVDWVVLHYTAGKREGDLSTLIKSPLPGRPSSHFYIPFNGDIYQLVSLDKAAFHAGINALKAPERARRLRPNERSVGIELEGFGTFTEAQYKALAWVLPLICLRFRIPIMVLPDPWKGHAVADSTPYDIETLERFRGILGHGSIHASKVDPGINFEYDRIKSLTPLPIGPVSYPEEVIWRGDPSSLPPDGISYA